MGTTIRHEASTLTFLDQVSHYSFYRCLQMLETRGINKFLLKPSAIWSFTSSDILRAHASGDTITLELGFMGLYGIDAPLPHYLLQQASQGEAATAISDFLDIFNQRIYQLLYLAWKNLQATVDLKQPASRLLYYLKALSGFVLNDHDSLEFAYVSHLSHRSRSSVNLSRMLQALLDGVKVQVKQFIPSWVELTMITTLGNPQQPMVLGHNTLLGTQALDLTRQLEIEIGPLSIVQVGALLPDKPEGRQLLNLIKRYLGPGLAFTLIYVVLPTPDLILTLGQDPIALGLYSWVGVQNRMPYRLRRPGN